VRLSSHFLVSLLLARNVGDYLIRSPNGTPMLG